jgi:hypothetical protein
MSALTIIETVLLVVALVYIVALLRSHADILRRLTALEDGAGVPGHARSVTPAGVGDLRAADISGITLDGDSVTLSLGPGSPVTLLAFLSSGCASCAPLWASLREAQEVAPLAERVLIVTHDGSRESPTRVRRLAPSGVETIMATAAWEDYVVPASPHFVLTDGAGGILGRGSALSWSQLVAMVHEARADVDGVDGVGGGGRGGGGMPARTTAERAARSERALARSGIGPGHPSLYPSETDPPHGEAR